MPGFLQCLDIFAKLNRRHAHNSPEYVNLSMTDGCGCVYFPQQYNLSPITKGSFSKIKKDVNRTIQKWKSRCIEAAEILVFWSMLQKLFPLRMTRGMLECVQKMRPISNSSFFSAALEKQKTSKGPKACTSPLMKGVKGQVRARLGYFTKA